MAGAKAQAADWIGLPQQENKTRTYSLGPKAPDLTFRCTLEALPQRRCRFPVGRVTGHAQLFCGRPAKRGPYCARCAPRTRITGSAMSKEEAKYWAAVAEGAR